MARKYYYFENKEHNNRMRELTAQQSTEMLKETWLGMRYSESSTEIATRIIIESELEKRGEGYTDEETLEFHLK